MLIKIRHLSTLVAFTDLIAVNDSNNKTAESTRTRTAKFPKCFPKNCAKLRHKRFLECQVKRRATGASTIGMGKLLGERRTIFSCFITGSHYATMYRKGIKLHRYGRHNNPLEFVI